MSDRRREAGFTLLELMAALVILGLGLTLLIERVGDASRAAILVDHQRHAEVAAQSLFSQLGHTLPLIDGPSDGDIGGGMHWHLVIAPFSTGVSENPSPPLAGHLVNLTIGWQQDGHTQSADFHTMMLAPAS